MKSVIIDYIIDEIVDLLLMNKSVLFVSDIYEYSEIITLLKENFEDISLFGLTYLKTNSILQIKEVENFFDNSFIYLSSKDDVEQAKTVLSDKCFIF